LPAELRNAIHEYAFDYLEICVSSFEYAPGFRLRIFNITEDARTLRQRTINPLTLTETCRQMHHECKLHPLKFSYIYGISGMRCIINFANALSEEQRGAIEMLHLSMWAKDDVGILVRACTNPSSYESKFAIQKAASSLKGKTLGYVVRMVQRKFTGVKHLDVRDMTSAGHIRNLLRGSLPRSCDVKIVSDRSVRIFSGLGQY
jgi:hypothetical protein